MERKKRIPKTPKPPPARGTKKAQNKLELRRLAKKGN